MSGYATTYAVFLVIGGRLGDARRPAKTFVTGIGAFTVASLLCGLAPTAGWLVAARILQGAAAALVVPQTLSTIQATGDGCRGPRRSAGSAPRWHRGRGRSGFGGWLIDANIAGSSWRPIFLVNVPLGLVGMVLAARVVPETRALRVARPDLRGAALLAASVVCVLVPLTEGQALHWPWWSWVLLAISPVWAVAFVATERRLERTGRHPLVPISLLPTAACAAGSSSPRRSSPASRRSCSSTRSPPRRCWAGARSRQAWRSCRWRPRSWSRRCRRPAWSCARPYGHHRRRGRSSWPAWLVIWGLEHTWPHTTPWSLLPGLVVMGFGQGLTMPSLIRVVLSEVPLESAGAGSGVFTTMQQLCLALGVAPSARCS